MHVPALPRQPDAGHPLLGVQPLAVLGGCGGGQPPAVPAHHLVHDQHPRPGPVLADDVARETGGLLGGGPGAEQAAGFARNIIGEHRSGPRMLIVHEVMGRHCGWLTAAAAAKYREWLDTQEWVPSIGLSRERWDVHAVFLPEMALDIEAEAARLRTVMDEIGNVTIFLSEGAGTHEIIAQMEESGETVQRDAFGHVRLDTINP